MAKVDFKNMTGKELFEFYTNVEGDGELFELVPLLPLAVGSVNAVYSILEEIHQKEKKLLAYYPEFDKKVPSGKLIGNIPDGQLYLS